MTQKQNGLIAQINELFTSSGVSEKDIDVVIDKLQKTRKDADRVKFVGEVQRLLLSKFFEYHEFGTGDVDGYVFVTDVFGSQEELFINCISIQFSESTVDIDNYFDFDAGFQIGLHDVESLDEIKCRFYETDEATFLSKIDECAAKAPKMIRERLESNKAFIAKQHDNFYTNSQK